jgi:PAS domain-containing protein
MIGNGWWPFVKRGELDLIQNLPVGVYRANVGGEGSFVMANQTIADMFGYNSPEEFCKIPVSQIFADRSWRKVQLDKIKEKKQLERKKTRFKRKNDEIGRAHV